MEYNKHIETDLEVIFMFGRNLSLIREDLDISQKELAKILRISTQTMSAYETGARIPTLSGLQIILETLNNHFGLSLTYNDLLKGGVNKPLPILSEAAQSFLSSRKTYTADSTVDHIASSK